MMPRDTSVEAAVDLLVWVVVGVFVLLVAG